MRNGSMASVSLWQIWVLTLDCGHNVKRPHNGFAAPKKAKCGICDPKSRKNSSSRT
jgi:hypothetical protein